MNKAIWAVYLPLAHELLFSFLLCVSRLTQVYAMDGFLASWLPVGISDGSALIETMESSLENSTYFPPSFPMSQAASF